MVVGILLLPALLALASSLLKDLEAYPPVVIFLVPVNEPGYCFDVLSTDTGRSLLLLKWFWL